jgi:hypothetical protein
VNEPLAPRTITQQSNLKTTLKKKHGVRAIDQGTVYDIPGQLQKAARDLSRNPHAVTDAMLIERHSDGTVSTFHWGRGGRPIAHWMAATAKNRLEPA